MGVWLNTMNTAIVLGLVASIVFGVTLIFYVGKRYGKKDIQLEGEKIYNDKLTHLADKNEEISQKYDNIRKKLTIIPDANDIVSSIRTNKRITKAKTTKDRRYSFKQGG